MSNNIWEIEKEEEFESFKSNSDPKRILIAHFWATWSEAHQHLDNVLKELATEAGDKNKNLKFLVIEAEKFPEICISSKVDSVPYTIFMKEGHIFDRLKGADSAMLTRKVRKLIDDTSVLPLTIPKQYPLPPATQTAVKQSDLEKKLKHLVNQSKCVLFMKGSPNQPKCGFSNQIVDLLNNTGVDFSTFDILEDNEVREGLKKYSNWPTYPQLYLNGELVGGLDIVRESLETDDEFLQKLPKHGDSNQRLNRLINKAPLMIFMKGSPQQPRCKFSKSLMEIFSKNGISVFDTFDILEDDSVREGLKKYSNWPTYPQIYVKGEFIGGLDIVKELDESGELQTTLTPES